MIKTQLLVFFFLIFAMAGAHEVAYGKQRSRLTEQVNFSAEDSHVQKPVAIPKDVLDILRRDEMVGFALEAANMPVEKTPLSWFSTSAIHLSNPHDADLVVMAVDKLRGANVTEFWVFCATPRGFELVMNATAHDLRVEKTRWKGHRDIELISITAREISTVWCRFDGKKYSGYKTKSEPIQ